MAGHLNEAFLQHLNPHLGIAHKVARLYCPDAGDREDLLQEMMYQLWRSFPGFDGRSKFTTWMYRVCLNTALAFRRKNIREKHEPLSPAHHQQHGIGAGITYLLGLLSCIAAIRAENRKSFREPIQQLQALLDEFKSEI